MMPGVGGAMGVRQDFYTGFAEWLASQGLRVTTFDYRGTDYLFTLLRGYYRDADSATANTTTSTFSSAQSSRYQGSMASATHTTANSAARRAR